jgi:pyruvate/2-oxoglutarate dehydrogenase complex dihydrolipoamide acyltransferase (E2) component
MVKKMNEANQVPQFGYGDDVCMDKLMALRKEIQPAGKQQLFTSVDTLLTDLPLFCRRRKIFFTFSIYFFFFIGKLAGG